jgi:uracil-DNA glycosylase family 4
LAVDSQRRNRYLDAMGVDVWVRRPGGSLAGVGAWDAQASANEGEQVAPVLAEVAVARPPMPLSAPSSPAPFEPASGDVAARWDALRTEVLSCTKCVLHQSRTQGVLGVGPRRSDWMVIGEAPGAEEDRRGEPFVGRGGHLLDAMLHAIGLNRGTNVYIANVLKSRPPGNRDPKSEEVAACLPYLMRQIELLQPRLMLAVGRIAAQNLLSTDLSLGRLRGKVHHFGEFNTPLIVTYHPAYLLRTPADKSKAWEDLKFARSVFRQLTDRVGTDGDLS